MQIYGKQTLAIFATNREELQIRFWSITLWICNVSFGEFSVILQPLVGSEVLFPLIKYFLLFETLSCISVSFDQCFQQVFQIKYNNTEKGFQYLCLFFWFNTELSLLATENDIF